jgi:hypothetical protein
VTEGKFTVETARPKRVWPVALAVIVVAAALASAAMCIPLFLGAPPDGTRATLYRVAATQSGMAAGSAAMIAFVTWLAAHIGILRHRGSFAKSILVLVLAVLIAATASASTRLRVVAVHQNAYRAALGSWMTASAGHIGELNHGLQVRLNALDAQQRPWAEIDAASLAQEIETRRQAIAALSEHQRVLTHETTSVLTQLPDDHPRWRRETALWFETHLQLVHRTFELEQQFMETELQILELLAANEGQWINSDGSFTFAERELRAQFDALIIQRQDLKDRAMQAAQAWADAESPPTPIGSVQLPPR